MHDSRQGHTIAAMRSCGHSRDAAAVALTCCAPPVLQGPAEQPLLPAQPAEARGSDGAFHPGLRLSHGRPAPQGAQRLPGRRLQEVLQLQVPRGREDGRPRQREPRPAVSASRHPSAIVRQLCNTSCDTARPGCWRITLPHFIYAPIVPENLGGCFRGCPFSAC